MAYIVAYEKERLMNRLELDRIGIIADVLIKHDKIRYLDEIYKHVCDDKAPCDINN